MAGTIDFKINLDSFSARTGLRDTTSSLRQMMLSGHGAKIALLELNSAFLLLGASVPAVAGMATAVGALTAALKSLKYFISGAGGLPLLAGAISAVPIGLDAKLALDAARATRQGRASGEAADLLRANYRANVLRELFGARDLMKPGESDDFRKRIRAESSPEAADAIAREAARRLQEVGAAKLSSPEQKAAGEKLAQIIARGFVESTLDGFERQRREVRLDLAEARKKIEELAKVDSRLDFQRLVQQAYTGERETSYRRLADIDAAEAEAKKPEPKRLNMYMRQVTEIERMGGSIFRGATPLGSMFGNDYAKDTAKYTRLSAGHLERLASLAEKTSSGFTHQ